MKTLITSSLLTLLFFGDAEAFLQISTLAAKSHCPSSIAAAPAKDVWILPSEEEVTLAVHKIVEKAASDAICERGHFALAIPGGSVLKVG